MIEFEVTRPHRELVIDARTHVTTEPPAADWPELAGSGHREAGAEFLLQTDEAAGHPLTPATVGSWASAT